jgi:transcriptional regulator with PAS, ATPase and Fis domain
LFAKTSWLDLANLETAIPHCSTKEEPLLRLEEVERQYIAKVLARVDQNKSKAARILGISRTTLREKLG